VLLVVTFHAGLPVRGGFVGVDVFFVISGFVITALLGRELAATGRLSFTTFYTRRVRRLLPALGLMVTFTLVGSLLLQSPYGLFYSPQEVTAKTGIGAMLIVANAVLYATGGGYFAVDADSNPLLHTWSLSVEEQFYLIFPLLLLIGWIIGRRRARSRRGATLLVVLLGVGSFALSYVLSYGLVSVPRISDPAGFAFYSSFTRAWEFAAGAVLALTVAHVQRLPQRIATPLALVGALLVVAGGLAIRESQPFPGLVAVVPVLGTVLLIAAGTIVKANPISRALATTPMVWLGDRSYSWYLWHWPFIVFAALLWPDRSWVLATAALASLLPTWFTYRYFENAIRISPIFGSSRRVVALATVVVLVPCLLALFVLQSVRTSAFGQLLAAPLAGWDTHECAAAAQVSNAPTICRFPAKESSAPSVMLVGDSHAASLTDAFVRVATSSGFTATTSTVDGCNYAKATVIVKQRSKDAQRTSPCADYYAVTDSWLAQNPQRVVVLANRSPFYAVSGVDLHDELVRGEVLCLVNASSCVTGDKATAVWTNALATEVKRLTETGSRVVVYATVPEHSTDAPAASSLLRGVQARGTDRALVEARRGALVAAERKAVSAIPGATYVDPIDDFCSDSVCVQAVESEFAYVDDDHLSVSGGRLTDSRLQAAIDEALQGS